jgi:hypothetical protein
MTIAPMRFAASLLATSIRVTVGLAVVMARPFCLSIAATFMASPSIATTLSFLQLGIFGYRPGAYASSICSKTGTAAPVTNY